jgi:tetratricopeptide (TPR) repeat protein
LDEPFWTALAVGSLGWVEVGMGRYDDALRHLRDAYDLGDGFDSAWLAAWSRVQLGTLDFVQGRTDEARDLLNEALALSLAAHSTGSVTLCLVAFARYAVMEGDAERAALLAGAAEGLRRRVGLRAWPMLRHEEDDLVAQIREALGAGRFDQVYAAGARLSQRDAVTAVRDRVGPGNAAAPSRPGTSSRS